MTSSSPAPDGSRADTKREPVAYSRDAVLTLSQLAAALQVCERTAASLDLPSVTIGKRPRYLWGQCLDVLAQRAVGLKKVA